MIPAIIAVYTYAYNYIDKEVRCLEHKSIALNQMQSIYSIIINLQKIRGLSNIEDPNIKVFDDIEALEKKNYQLAEKVHNPRVKEILQRHPHGTISDFESYTFDIEALLLIYKLTAYNAELTLNSNIKEYLLSKSITNGLPYLAEYFARIRGLASSVSNHKLDDSIKLKIKNQRYMIEELLKNAQEMKYFNKTNFVQTLLSSQQKEIAYINKEIINSDNISLNGLEIFKNITKNIDFLNTLYYKNMQKLNFFYKNKIADKNFLKLLIIITCIVSIIIVILVNLFYFAKIQKYIKKVEHLNVIDPMTQLYNRRFLENFITQLNTQTKEQNEFFSILMIDIDFFKKVNDTYGHDIGDKVIIQLATVLLQNIRKSDLGIRYGGEEFMIILRYADIDAAFNVATKIKNIFSQIEFHSNTNETFKKTLSIGIAEFPKHHSDVWQCIKFADSALYKAKTTGRDKIVIYSEELQDKPEAKESK